MERKNRGGRGRKDSRGSNQNVGYGQQRQRQDGRQAPEARVQQFPEHGARGGGRSGGVGDRRDNDWICPVAGCGNNNFGFRQQCYRCNADKPAGAKGSGEQVGARGRGQAGPQRGGFQRGGGHGGRGWGRGGADHSRRYERGQGDMAAEELDYVSTSSSHEGSYEGWKKEGPPTETQRSYEHQTQRKPAWGAQQAEAAATAEEAPSQQQPRTSQRPVAPSSAPQGDDAQLSKDLSSLSIKSSNGGPKKQYEIPHREKDGTRGRKITIEVNHFLLNLDNIKNAIQYDCTFNPEKLSKRLTREVMEGFIKKHFQGKYPAFDSRKNLYSAEKLFPEGTEFTGTEELVFDDLDAEGNQRKLSVQVTIKEATEGKEGCIINMKEILDFKMNGGVVPQRALQALDIVLRNPGIMRFTPVGRSLFKPPTRTIKLGNGMEVWAGFFLSPVVGSSTFLNLDVAHKAFPEPKLVTDIMLDIKRNFERRDSVQLTTQSVLGYKELPDFTRFIKGLKVIYEVGGIRRNFTVTGVGHSSREQRVVKDDNSQTTVEQYFKNEKRCVLRYPNLPCLEIRRQGKKAIHLPPEFCTVTPKQIVMKKLDPMQTTKMIREAATKPYFRKQKIMDARRDAGFNNDLCMKKFGVSVAEEFEQVDARILEPPALLYNKGTVMPRNGTWEVEPFLAGKPLERWVILNISRATPAQINKFSTDMKAHACKLGMLNISAPIIEDVDKRRLEITLKEKFSFFKGKGCQLVVVVIPDGPFYGQVKNIAEKESGIGILTQCIKEKTLSRLDFAIVKNLLLKVNTKLNGINHTLLIQGESRKGMRKVLDGAMIMGADVSHPSPDQKTIPSVAAVTASHDTKFFQYNMMWTLQPPKKEIIENLKDIVEHQINFYMKQNGGQEPKTIIIYRDGVGEGMFGEVLAAELTAIKIASARVLGRELPVTFIVVQKRHHTRFFPMGQRDGDKNGNALPGTIVDTTITHPKELNFYLVSHASPQGTARPTKYHKLWDDNKIDVDDLEELTHYLCHMFSRCTRAVSYPAPTYYAHLAAFRARVYIEGMNIDLDNLKREMETHKLHTFVLDSPMFFT